MPAPPGPFDAVLAPLSRLALRHPGVEGQAVWWQNPGWAAQDDGEDLLDAEEIAFYAEGLLAEGFGLHWQLLAESDSPKDPVLVLLFFWQSGSRPDLPSAEPGWTLLQSGGQEPR